MSKSTKGLRKAGIASLAVGLTLGAGIAAAGSASAVADFKFDRIGGVDRYETAALVADEYGTYTEAILANGEPGNYADALTANYLSGVKKAPILLTRVDKTPKFTLDELKESGATKVTIVGGVGVVSAAQEKALKDAGYTVTRVAGSDRFKTNAEVIEAGGAAKDLGVIATGFNFPDALGGGPLAYNGHALGLSKSDDIDDDVVAALKAAGVKKVIVLGGPTIVGDKVVAELKAAGIELEERIFGADRSITSTKLADFAIKNAGFTNTAANVASGYTEGYGADALAGGPLTGMQKRPMLITRDVNNVGDLDDWMKAHADTLKEGIIFGGTGAVSAAAQDQMEKAARTAPESATSRPELRSASITGTVRADQATPGNPAGTTVVYTFDENVATVTAGATTAFHAYNADRSEVTGGTVVSTSANTVTVRFNSADTAAEAGAITVATVDAGAVTDTQGQGGTAGDAALGSTSGGGTTTLPAGITDAPDLVSVGNFRQASEAGKTAVDFTFDQPAHAVATTGYSLILLDGAEGVANDNQVNGTGPAAASTTPSGGTIAGGNGTTTITVIFTNPDGVDDNNAPGDATDPMVAAADVARGAIAPATVESGAATATASAGVDNVLQTVDVSNGGNTAEPDLVSVDLRPGTTADPADKALFTFDAPVASAVVANFKLYDVDGAVENAASLAINSSNRSQVLVTFDNDAADDAVGGYILDGAVKTAAIASPVTPEMENEQDEVGVSNTASSEGQTSGRTVAPDLTGVKLVRAASDVFGNPGNWTAVYTFDEDVDVNTVGDFKLYSANGAAYTATACAVTAPGSGQTAEDVDNSVTCNAFGTATSSDQIGAATLGTVDDGAVDEQGDSVVTNVEGAEFTTGGTGTVAR